MESAENDNKEVHSEIIESKKSRVSKSQNDDSQQFSEYNSNKNRRTHDLEWLFSPLFSSADSIHEGYDNMDTEFNRQTYSNNEVDDWNSINLDLEAREEEVSEITESNNVKRNTEDSDISEESTCCIFEEHHDKIDYSSGY